MLLKVFHVSKGCVHIRVCVCVNVCSSVLFLFQDQYDVIEKHTQSGLDLVERYIKFVKERTEIEQHYAKQLRCAQWFLSESLFLHTSARIMITTVTEALSADISASFNALTGI